MRILVTGGAGYIGSHTAKALSAAGHTVIVLDNLITGHRAAVKWGPLIEGNCGNIELTRSVLRDRGIESVIHFAASAYVGESMTDPQGYFQNNVVQTLNLLAAMRAERVRRIVFSSTCATYGVPDSTPITEDHPQRPVNPYGESKLFVERVLQWYESAYQLRWVALRYFNAAGADPEGELWEQHDPETHLIPLALEAALGNRPHLNVYGTDYETPDGTAIRDYTHVSDLASVHVRSVEYLANGGASLALNAGTGSGRSVREVIQSVEAVSGMRVPVRYLGRRPGDPPILVANPARAREVLDWTPRYADLDDIVGTAMPPRSRMAAKAAAETSAWKPLPLAHEISALKGGQFA